jgi:hypothetical protein
MNKILTITNGIESIDIECTPKIHTRVSEECVNQFLYTDIINPEEIVLSVLLKEIEITDKTNWRIKNEHYNLDD